MGDDYVPPRMVVSVYKNVIVEGGRNGTWHSG